MWHGGIVEGTGRPDFFRSRICFLKCLSWAENLDQWQGYISLWEFPVLERLRSENNWLEKWTSRFLTEMTSIHWSTKQK